MEDMNKIAKEVLETLQYFEDDVVQKIPKRFLDFLKELASDCNEKVDIDVTIGLEKQNILEESKDVIALIYYSYIANEEEKIQIMNCWNENEIEYQKKLREKYNIDNVFENKLENKKVQIKDNENKIESNMLVIKKESLLDKIISIIKNLFKNKNC